jgi:DNA repair exonuclease SbcCD ATPase subunit
VLIEQEIEKIRGEKASTLNKMEKDYVGPKQGEFDLTNLKDLEEKFKYGNSKIAEMIEAGRKIQGKIDNIASLRTQAQSLGSQIKQLNENKAEIEKSICHTCKQTWTGETAKAEIEKIRSNMDKLTTQALSLKSEIDQEDQHKSDLQRLYSIQEEVETRNKMCQEAMLAERDKYTSHTASFEAAKARAEQEHGDKYREVERGFEARTAKLQDAAYKIHTEFTQKDTEFKGFKARTKEYETEVESLTKNIGNKNGEMAARDKAILELEGKISIAEEAKRLVKTYVLQTFQETLDLIGEMATEIIGSIPNMSNATIYFEGCKETKSGTIKDEVNAIINMDGINNIPIKSLCGGEGASINLAVDFAAIDVIEARANKGANFMIIDEPFNGLDSVCKEECLEVLNQIDTKKKIIMIDHSSELKETVSDVITVVRTGESSIIQQ